MKCFHSLQTHRQVLQAAATKVSCLDNANLRANVSRAAHQMLLSDTGHPHVCTVSKHGMDRVKRDVSNGRLYATHIPKPLSSSCVGASHRSQVDGDFQKCE